MSAKERPHPGAQLCFTEHGHRVSCFVTGTQAAHSPTWNYATAGAKEYVRTARDTGLHNLPPHDFTHNKIWHNQIWLEIIALACELLARMQTLALHGTDARYYKSQTPTATLARHRQPTGARSRRLHLRIPTHWPWARQIITALPRLHALPAPTRPSFTAPTSRKESRGPVEPPPTRRDSRAILLTTARKPSQRRSYTG
ncbi:Transposase DDE domain group 1 [Nonomuraea maritima]|uniref:Transposase DDE domain group 1 n=1 Tax=Nonomuraea maritima TaxID=683260 RepID=A0A1G9T2H0_9ACTN|nr:transposase [Nonomuraea maritima]SDM41807.1 Transposase DDE domain group 1 [Nonomuraea maritima]